MDINSQKMIPLAIIVAGVVIAGAILYASGDKSLSRTKSGGTTPEQNPGEPLTTDAAVKAVHSADHIFGNPDASVFVVEFSDTECPFCQRFHTTMHQVIDEYGEGGKVAWVYRHFPLDSLHPKARKEAEATECANELGGNTKFWAYLDRIFTVTPANNGLDPAELPNIAEYVGLDKSLFETCLASGKYAQHVADDLADALESGGQGTPHTIVIAPNAKKFLINGAQPYATVKSVIDLALAEVD